jgi:hypothetical protein
MDGLRAGLKSEPEIALQQTFKEGYMSKSFPIDISSGTRIAFDERRLLEGQPFNGNAVTSTLYASATVALNTLIGQSTVLAGKMAYIDSVTFSSTSDTPALVQMLLASHAIMNNTAGVVGYPSSLTGADYKVNVSKFSSVTVEVKQWVYENSYLNFYLREALSAYSGRLSMTVSGTMFTNDKNFNAPVTMVVDGDSISVGTLGAFGDFTSNDMFFWKMRNYFQAAGVNMRLVNKGAGGRNSSDSAIWMNTCDHYNIGTPISLYCFQMGMNEVLDTTYEANLRAKIAWWKRIRPTKGIMIVFGATAAQDNTKEALVQTTRVKAAAVVTEIADAKILYCNLGAAFDRTVFANYTVTEVSGSGIHPGPTGHAAIYTNAILPFLVANPSILTAMA